MNPERWKKIRRVFLAALEQDEAEREAFVRRELAGDDEAGESVLRMLAGEASAEGFIEAPPDLPREPFEPTPLPERLGDFTPLEKLGKGGMGVVYRAWQRRLEREVALKVLKPGAYLSKDVERFHREARTAGKLKHPGIVSILDSGREGETSWFAMPLIEGQNLAKEIEQLKLERKGKASSAIHLPSSRSHEYFRRVARCIRDVADALHHAHEKDIVHADVKPSNILIEPNGSVHVIDFGLAIDFELTRLTEKEMVAGSVPYLSPEQARAKRFELDRRTDVYSLGVVLYELLTLETPHRGTSDHEIITKILNEEATSVRRLNGRIPRDLETICEGAMAKLPRERYPTAGELRDELDRFLNGEAIVRKPDGLVRLAVRKARRHRVKLAGVGIAAFALPIGSWIAVEAAERARIDALTHITVRAFDADGDAIRANVLVRDIDPLTTIVSEARELGRTPLPPEPLETGYHRIVVVFDAGGFREVPVYADEAAKLVTIEVARRADEDSLTDGMVLIQPQTYTIPDYFGPRSLQGQKLELAGFYVSRTEVSNREYHAFVTATGHPEPSLWSLIEDVDAFLEEFGDYPVVDVSWSDAVAYCSWAGSRLPSVTEFHRFAGGPGNWPLPYSSDPELPWLGNVNREREETMYDAESMWRQYLRLAMAVDCCESARTPEGLYNTFGNVDEWTESLKVQSLQESGPVTYPYARFLGGGYWHAAHLSSFGGRVGRPMRAAGTEEIDNSPNFIGFRCVRSVAP